MATTTNTAASSPGQLPASSSKFHHPYFTPSEVEYLSEKQRGKISISQEDKVRQNACGFLEAMGLRIGLYVALSSIQMTMMIIERGFDSPRRTISTAQTLYHRFHLFFPRKDFNYAARIAIRSLHTPADLPLASDTGRRARSPIRVYKDARHAQEAPRTAIRLVLHPVPRAGCQVKTSRRRSRP